MPTRIGVYRSTPWDELLETHRWMYRNAGLALEEIQDEIADQVGSRRGLSAVKVNSLKGRTKVVTQQMRKIDLEFYNNIAPEIYRQGMSVGAGTAQELSEEDYAFLKKVKKQGLDELQKASNQVNKEATRVTNELNHLNTLRGTDTARKEAKRFVVRNGITAKTYANGRKYSLNGYGEMAVKARGQQIHNMGIVAGAERKGVKLLECQDGPGCGWTEHDDPERADGKIVTLDEARSYPIAHPHCVRTFIPRPDLEDKPKSGKSKTQKAAKIAGVVGAVGVVGAGAVTLAANKDFIQQAVELALGGAERISLADRIRGFTTVVNEDNQQIAKTYDLPVPAKVSEADVMDHMTAVGENWALGFSDTLPDYANYILALPENADRKAIGDAFQNLSNTADLQRLKAATADVRNAVEDFSQTMVEHWQEATDDFAAIRVNLPKIGGMPGPTVTLPKVGGIHLPRIAESTKYLKVQGTMSDQLKYMDTEGIAKMLKEQGISRYKIVKGNESLKSRAEMIADLGGFKSGILSRVTINPHGLARLGFGVTPDGKIYPNFRLVPRGPFRVATELSPKRKRTKEEVIKLAIKKGYKQLDKTKKVRGIKEIDFEELTRKEILVKIGEADKEIRTVKTKFVVTPGHGLPNIIFDFKNLQYQSVAAEMRMFAGHLVTNAKLKEGSISLRGNLELIRSKWVRSQLKLATKEVKDEEGNIIRVVEPGLKAGPGKVFDQFLDLADLVTSNFSPLSKNIKEQLSIIHGGIFQIAKTLRINWEDAVDLVKNTEKNFADLFSKHRLITGTNIPQSDLRGVIDMNNNGVFGRFTDDAIPARSYIDFEFLEEMAVRGEIDGQMVSDLKRAANFIDSTFPGEVGVRSFKLADMGTKGWSPNNPNGFAAVYFKYRNAIHVNMDTARTWSGGFRTWFQQQVNLGMVNPRYGNDPAIVFIHEYGHYFKGQLVDDEKRDLFMRIIESEQQGVQPANWDLGPDYKKAIDRYAKSKHPSQGGRPTFRKLFMADTRDADATMTDFMDRNRSIFAERFGAYATTDTDELISELFAEYFGAARPSKAAIQVGEFFLEKFGPGAVRVVGERPMVPLGPIPLPRPSSLLNFSEGDLTTWEKLTLLNGGLE